MSIHQQAPQQNRTVTRPSIWLALAAALGLHALLLFLPLTRQMPVTEHVPALLEVQLTTLRLPAPAPKVPQPQPEKESPAAIVEPEVAIAELTTEKIQTRLLPEPATPIQVAEPEILAELEKSSQASIILSRQFITEETVVNQIFGKPLKSHSSEVQTEFHYPARQDLLAMLDQPMPELPFAYTAGLVHFAYDPGVKGDLQRFWDVITPEFGWRTNNGTEFKCVWVLVIVGCGWK